MLCNQAYGGNNFITFLSFSLRYCTSKATYIECISTMKTIACLFFFKLEKLVMQTLIALNVNNHLFS